MSTESSLLSSSSKVSSSLFCNTDLSANNYNPSADIFHPYLSEEIENMVKNLKIDSFSHKISNDYQDHRLTDVIDCLMYFHYNSADIELLKNFFFEFNQKLCENPLEEEELEDLWVQQTAFIEVSSDDKKNHSSIKPEYATQNPIQQSESDLLQPELDALISNKGDV